MAPSPVAQHVHPLASTINRTGEHFLYFRKITTLASGIWRRKPLWNSYSYTCNAATAAHEALRAPPIRINRRLPSSVLSISSDPTTSITFPTLPPEFSNPSLEETTCPISSKHLVLSALAPLISKQQLGQFQQQPPLTFDRTQRTSICPDYATSHLRWLAQHP